MAQATLLYKTISVKICIIIITLQMIKTVECASLKNSPYANDVNKFSSAADDNLNYIKESKTLHKEQMEKLVKHFQPNYLEYGRKSNMIGKMECGVCKSVIWILQQTLKHNTKRFVEIADSVCKGLHIEDDTVCDGIVKIFKAEFATILEELVLDPEEACGLILGPTCAMYYDPFQMWNITLPDPLPHPVQPPSSVKKTLRVLHLTDIHVDLKYLEGSSVHCGRPVCCRSTSGKPKPGEPSAGHWGYLGHCDLAPRTLENLFQHLAHHKVDYVMWTGDLPSHADWDQTRASQLQHIDYLVNLFSHYLPNTPVYWSLGNHESVPVNGFPPPYIKGNDSISWLYTHLANVWHKWLPASAVQNITRGGFYTTLLMPGFRLISLNMNYGNHENWWTLLNTTDPTGELTWLVSVLYKAELAKEKVHIIGHIPPGQCVKAWSWNYYRIVDRFSATITGQFFGHTHRDKLEIYYDVQTLKKPISVAYQAPSATTFRDMNPGYRIYTVDGLYQGSSWLVLDHETYTMNLTEANINIKAQPQWKLEYTAKSAYNLPDLTATSWHELTERMLQANNTWIQKFSRYMYKSSPGLGETCDHNCTLATVCDIRSGRSYSPELCRDLSLDQEMYIQWQARHIMC